MGYWLTKITCGTKRRNGRKLTRLVDSVTYQHSGYPLGQHVRLLLAHLYDRHHRHQILYGTWFDEIVAFWLELQWCQISRVQMTRCWREGNIIMNKIISRFSLTGNFGIRSCIKLFKKLEMSICLQLNFVWIFFWNQTIFI